MQVVKLWVISYDIKNDRTRRKVHDILKNHGERVQFSVFECRLNNKEFEFLRSLVKPMLEREDSIRWYPLCKWCADKILCRGNATLLENNGFYMA